MSRVNLAQLYNGHQEVPEPGVRHRRNTSDTPRTLAVEQIAMNPLNLRPGQDEQADEELAETAETIRTHGVVQPLVVCRMAAFTAMFPDEAGQLHGADWVVLIGNRRLQAARLAELPEVPVLIDDERVADGAGMYELMLIENGQRRTLPLIHEARGIQRVLDERDVSIRELSRRIGKSHAYLVQRCALLKLIPELQAAVTAGELRVEDARRFGELSVEQQQAIAAAGKPYRMPAGKGERPKTARRIQASSPAVAAVSLRKQFTDAELGELLRLLREQTEQ